ncbi:MAG: dTMP kinase [Candidatus Aenigmatarchaeota archaeon]|nr:MAG: dTMP kinase [Candidatus Aenigmarchaeota archaeon]
MERYPGLFVVFEGLDGSGSTTQVKLLSGYLKERGYLVLETKEPTNNLIGGLIRGQLTHEWKTGQECLQLLFAADRAHHLEKEIIPAIKKGYIVISDRYMFSSMAFGGIDLDMEWIKKINERFILPDITFLLRVSPQVCLERIGKNRFGFQLFEEKEKLEKTWMNYQKIKKEFPNVFEIDGEQEIERVHGDIVNVMDEFLKKDKKRISKTLSWYFED